MDKYGKIFRLKKDNAFNLRIYNPDAEKYFELIKMARKDGLNQVIINSELMINLIYLILEKSELLMQVIMSDNTDQDIKDNIDNIVRKIRDDKFNFITLKEELEWAIDSGSIDIESIIIFFEGEKTTLKSNGIIYGKEIKSFFNKIINPVLESYFNV